MRDGAVVQFEVFGSAERSMLLLPTWSIVHTDFWRHQVAHFQQRYTVVTFDGLGNGASDRPTDPGFYADERFVTDALAVMEAAGIHRPAVISSSMAAAWQLRLADRFPDRVAAGIYIGADLPLAPLPAGIGEAAEHFDDPDTDGVGWGTYNRAFWRRDWGAFCRWFFSQCFTESDSEAEIEHFVSMGMETTPDVISATMDADGISEGEARRAATQLRVPSLAIHGDGDAIASVEVSREFARLSGSALEVLPGSGHEPHCRVPDRVNAIIDSFLAMHHPA